ncbi:MAG: TetR/AcrR family transcriptional regulator [Mycetocola sp.]
MTGARRAPRDGVRQHNTATRRAAIIAAATEAFATEGYEAASTQRIAAQVGLAHGTLFRYASTKSELHLLVYNEHFSRALDVLTEQLAAQGGGERSAGTSRNGRSGADRVVDGLVLWATTHGANALVYQREILYGSDAAREASQRERAHALVDRYTRLIAALIVDAPAGGRVQGNGAPDSDPDRTPHPVADPRALSMARLFFVGSQADLADVIRHNGDVDLLRQTLHDQLRIIQLGYAAERAHHRSPAGPIEQTRSNTKEDAS